MTDVEDLFQKIPPSSQEAEQGVLGSIYLDLKALDVVAEILKPGDFYREGHRQVYKAMLALSERGVEFDMLTVVEELRVTDKLERAGGAAYVAGLGDMVPSAAHVKHYAKIVKEKALLRAILATTQEIAARCYEDTGDVESFADEAQGALFDVCSRGITSTVTPIREASIKTLDYLKRVQKGESPGIPTGYYGYDELTGGLYGGDLIILAGRPGMGKTTLAMNIIRKVAGRGIPSLFYSLEMNELRITIRLLCADSGENSRDIKKHMSQNTLDAYLTAAIKIQNLPLFIDDTTSQNGLKLRSTTRRLVAQENIGLVVLDYMQFMRKSRKSGESREEEIADYSQALKSIAKENNIPVIAVCQLNRKIEDRADPKPKLSDLRESGAIEQDADVIVFLYKPKDEEGDLMSVDLAKQRNGPPGEFKLTFRGECNRFENYATDSMGGE